MAAQKEKTVPITNDQHHFDLPRLAEELQKVHKSSLDKSMKILEEEQTKTIALKNEITEYALDVRKQTSKEVSTFKNLLNDVSTAYLEQYNEEVSKTLSNIKSDLIAEIEKGRTIIHVNQSQEITVSYSDHPVTEQVIVDLNLYKKAMLVGPAGTGKTYMIAGLAKKLNLPFYKYSCSRDSSVHDLLGYKQPTSEVYLETAFLKCYENGGIFLVDEYDAMSGDMSLFFNGVADSSEFISVPHRDTKPTATKHKDFYIVMCGNTWGKGSHEFSGRDFQDQALMDRFRLCKHFVDYHKVLEQGLCENSKFPYSFIVKLRTSLEEIGSYLSTRNVEDICRLYKSDSLENMSANNKAEFVIKKMTTDLSESEKNTLYGKLF